MTHNSLAIATRSVAAGAILLAAGATGQVPEPETGPPRDTTPAAMGEPAEPLELAGRLVAGGGAVSAGFGTLQEQRVQVSRLDAQGEARDSRVFRRVLTASGGYGVAGSVTAWLSERWGVRLEGAVGAVEVEVGYPLAGWDYMQEADTVESRSGGTFSFRTGTASLLFGLPVSHPFYTPYALLGAGVTDYGTDETLAPGLATLEDGSGLLLTASYGLGAYVPVTKDLLLQLEAVRRTSPSPVDGVGTGTVLEGDSVRVEFVEPASDESDPTLNTVAGWHVSVGLSYRLPFRRGQRRDEEG